MVYISQLGRNWGPKVNWDFLGKLYASIAIAWTVVLLVGISWLVCHRHSPIIKMRNIPLAVAATGFLHVYLVKIFLAYTANGHFLCSAEFWIMSIYLPFGIALFQANMVQLLSISNQQRKLLEGDRISIRELPQHPLGIRGLWSRWRSLTALQRSYVLIVIGMLLQVVVTAAIYGTNKKLQGHWGNLPKPQGQALCRKGPEWIPSSFWQLFWSCIYGPYLLYKIRNIRDTHFWRLQAIICVISGIPGSPLWMAAVFSPKFKPINKYWVPPMWLAPGIIVMQAVTIFFPIYDAYKSRRLSQDTLSVLHAWEDREAWDHTTLGSRSTRTRGSSIGDTKSFPSKNLSGHTSNEMYTVGALEKALTVNPTPLLQFAATKDFTAENIIFLLAVRDWKATWATAPATTQARSILFHQAVDIYIDNVSEKLAEFPINIEGSIRSRLDAAFSPALVKLQTTGMQANAAAMESFDDVTPFAKNDSVGDFPLSPLRSPSSQVFKHEMRNQTSQSTLGQRMSGEASKEVDNELYASVVDFDERVFDSAENSIKYLVVTNTWRKFVSAMN